MREQSYTVHPLVRALRDARREAGITLSALAERSGYRINNIQSMEAGYNRPLLTKSVDIANALDFDVVLQHRGSTSGTSTSK